MTALVAILRREVGLRSGLLPLALILGLTPFLGPALGVSDRGALATFMVLAVGIASIVLTGASVIATDLAERRMGFLFARPISWWSIWAGKMLAAVLLTGGSLALVSLPALLTGDVGLDGGGWIGVRLVPAVLAALGAVHFAAVAYRSRDAWVAVDVLLLTVALTGAVVLTTVVEANGVALAAGERVVVVAVWVLAVVLVAASAVQLRVARGDIVRGHRVLSVVIWSAVAAILASGGILLASALRPAPSDLRRIRSAVSLPGGSWISVGGGTTGSVQTWPQFVLDTRSGRWIRTGDLGFFEPAFSADGRWIVWRERGWTSRRVDRIAVADLRSAEVGVRRWTWPADAEDGPMPLAVTPGGEQALVAAGPRAYWLDLRTGRVTSPVSAVPGTLTAAVAFDGPRARAVRVQAPGAGASGSADVVEVGADAERVLGTMAYSGHLIPRRTADGSGLLITERGAGRASRITLHDGATADLRAVLVERGAARAAVADFLGDGRIAVVVTANDTRLTIVRSDGSAERTIVLAPTPRTANTLAEVALGVVGVTLGGGTFEQARTLLVDVEAGIVRREEPGLRVARGWSSYSGGVRLEGTRPLFLSGQSLVEMDLTTGTRHALLGSP